MKGMPMPTPLEKVPDRANTAWSPSFMSSARPSGISRRKSSRPVPKNTTMMSSSSASSRTLAIERNSNAGNSE